MESSMSAFSFMGLFDGGIVFDGGAVKANCDYGTTSRISAPGAFHPFFVSCSLSALAQTTL